MRAVKELKQAVKVPKTSIMSRNWGLVRAFLSEMRKGSSLVFNNASAAEGEGGVGGRSAMRRVGKRATTEMMAHIRTVLFTDSASVVMAGMTSCAKAAANELETDPIMVAVARPCSVNQTAAYLGGTFIKKG